MTTTTPQHLGLGCNLTEVKFLRKRFRSRCRPCENNVSEIRRSRKEMGQTIIRDMKVGEFYIIRDSFGFSKINIF